jgi:hypothetical protein
MKFTIDNAVLDDTVEDRIEKQLGFPSSHAL